MFTAIIIIVKYDCRDYTLSLFLVTLKNPHINDKFFLLKQSMVAHL